MLELFRQYLRDNHLLGNNEKVLVAVSGGVDSMVLLDLFKDSEYEFAIVHCNFKLRGEESDKDEKLVRDVGAKLNVHVYTQSFETKEYALNSGISTQMAARELRYKFFNEIMDEHAFHKLATAHHKDDQFETALYNFIKGTGVKGLVPFSIEEANNQIIRPLMFLTRDEIVEYAKEKNLKWREDESNKSPDYHRNRIRLKVIPELLQINPSLVDTYENTFLRLEETNQVLLGYVDDFKKSFVKMEEDETIVSKNGLIESKAPTLILYNLLKERGFNYSQCREIAASLSAQTGKRFISETSEVLIDREFIRIFSSNIDKLTEVVVGEDQKKIKVGNGTLFLEIIDKVEISNDPLKAELDARNIRFPLKIRSFKQGDRFHPLGMSQSKKISDFLIDEKVTLSKKRQIPIVFSGNEVIWIVGMRIDNRYKVKDSTNKILRLRYEEDEDQSIQ